MKIYCDYCDNELDKGISVKITVDIEPSYDFVQFCSRLHACCWLLNELRNHSTMYFVTTDGTRSIADIAAKARDLFDETERLSGLQLEGWNE